MTSIRTATSAILAIDIGNTRVKWAVFKSIASNALDLPIFNPLSTQNLTTFDRHLALQSLILHHGNVLHQDLATLNLPEIAFAESTQVIISQVADDAVLDTLMGVLKPQTNIQLFNADELSCGIQNHYDNPPQLGSDRWAALIAAWHLHASDCVVVNAGTAVTMDVLHRAKVNSTKRTLNHSLQTSTPIKPQPVLAHFMGGLILPGLHLMQTSLHQNTAHLQAKSHALETRQVHDFIAKNTKNAISQGAITAIGSSVLSVVEAVKSDTGNSPAILLSGGDASAIAAWLDQALTNMHGRPLDEARLIFNAPVIIEKLVLYGLFFANHHAFNIINSNQ